MKKTILNGILSAMALSSVLSIDVPTVQIV